MNEHILYAFAPLKGGTNAPEHVQKQSRAQEEKILELPAAFIFIQSYSVSLCFTT